MADSSSSAAISFGGLASGLDVNAIVSALVGVERIPIERLQAQQSDNNKAKDTFSSFLSKLTTLKTNAETLQDPTNFNSYDASSTDSAVVASVSGTAAPGSWTLTNVTLAKEERSYSGTATSSSSDAGYTGTLSITVGTNGAQNVTLDGKSLSTIAADINALQASGSRASASVLWQGGTTYRLQVRSLDTGATEGAISFSGSTMSFTEAQTASNATFTVDTYNITSSTNQVTGVIPGITLTLAATTATTTITVANDTTALKKKIQDFVTSYNDVVNAGHTASGFGAVKASITQLSGDSAIRTSLDSLARIIGNEVTGGSGKYKTPYSVGIQSQNDGTLKFNETVFDAAFTADSNAVRKIFTTDTTIAATGFMEDIADQVEVLTTNTNAIIQTRIDGLTSINKQIDDQILKLEANLEIYEANLRQKFTEMEKLISTLQQQGASLSALQ